VVDICSCLNQSLCNFQTVPLDCDGESCLSFGSDCVGISIKGNEQVEQFKVAVKCNSHKGSLFVVLDKRIIDDFRMFLEQGTYIWDVFALDVVVEEVLLGVEGLAITHSI